MAERGDPCIFGTRMRTMRERLRLTRKGLAGLAQVSYQTIWKLERGERRDPGITLCTKIARALRVSLDYLAGLIDDVSERWAGALATVAPWERSGPLPPHVQGGVILE
jgi:DNA-binding XRE family transcriptional regulator